MEYPGPNPENDENLTDDEWWERLSEPEQERIDAIVQDVGIPPDRVMGVVQAATVQAERERNPDYLTEGEYEELISACALAAEVLELKVMRREFSTPRVAHIAATIAAMIQGVGAPEWTKLISTALHKVPQKDWSDPVE